MWRNTQSHCPCYKSLTWKVWSIVKKLWQQVVSTSKIFQQTKILKDSQRCCLQKCLHGYFQGKNIYSMWKGFLPRALLLVSAKWKRKAPRKFVSQYELTLGSTQMQFLAELIYVHQIPQDRSHRGCYWQIGHMLAGCKGASIPAERVAAWRRERMVRH